MNLCVKGLVLKDSSFGEGDKVLTVLAEGLGRISVWARGARRVGSPFLAASHPFTYAQFTLFSSKGKYKLDGAEILESNFAIRNDIESLALAGYMAELVCAAAMENQREDEILRLAVNALYLLAKGSMQREHLKAVFELRLCCEAGFLPELTECVFCGRREGLSAFDPCGGVLCAACAPKGTCAKSVSSAVLKALWHVANAEEKSPFSFELKGEAQPIFAALCEEYAVRHLEFSGRTLGFYKAVSGGKNDA